VLTNVEAIVGGNGAYRGARGQVVTDSVSRTVQRPLLSLST